MQSAIGPAQAGYGQPPGPSGAARRIAGVELGGTKCVTVLADGAGAIIEQRTIPTTGPDETLAAIRRDLRRWWEEARFDALGIASFGPLDLDPASAGYGRITATPKPGWRDAAVASRLTADLPVPFAFDTDVNGAALAEGRWGAAKGLADYAYVTVGTGVGVGLIVRGAPTRGLGHCEAGHMPVPRLAGDEWPGSCPYHGACVEGLASGPAIKARLGEVEIGETGADHPVWDGVVDALAHLAAALVLTAGPRRILIGGGVATGQPHLLPRIESRLVELIGGYLPVPSGGNDGAFVQPPALGAATGPLGAIALGLALAEPMEGKKE